VCPEKNEFLSIFVLASEKLPELNIVKCTQTCTYFGFSSQILYNSTVPFNRFSIFTKPCHKLHFPTLFTNLLTHGAYVMHDCQAVLINKMLSENKVLINRVDKGYGMKSIINEFMQSWAFCKSESIAAGSVTSTI